MDADSHEDTQYRGRSNRLFDWDEFGRQRDEQTREIIKECVPENLGGLIALHVKAAIAEQRAEEVDIRPTKRARVRPTMPGDLFYWKLKNFLIDPQIEEIFRVRLIYAID